MTLTNGPNLGLLVGGAAGEAHYSELMRQWRGLDALVMPIVHAYLVNTPPGSPADGYTAIIGAAPTGPWAGKGGQVTRWSGSLAAYEYYTPKDGWLFQSNSGRETYRRTGGVWEIYYQEGTWGPTANALGGSGITFPTASYTKIGGRVDFTLQINGTGMTATISPSTSVTLPFTPTKNSACALTSTAVGFNATGLCYTDGKLYLPAISSTSTIVGSGTLFL